jgi:hypothetical protein
MCGACFQERPLPFLYLLPDYGRHKDGKVRRTSVWPVFLAAKLSMQYNTISLVFTFGDQEHPEDYSVGDGPGLFFDFVLTVLKEYAGSPTVECRAAQEAIISQARRGMKQFAGEHAPTMLKVLPGYCESGSDALEWPLAGEVLDDIAFTSGDMIRHDAFLEGVYKTVKARRGYTLSPLAGSKPQKLERLNAYKAQHVKALCRYGSVPPDYQGYDVDPSSFPKSKNGNYHVTSSTDTVFLLDNPIDLLRAYSKAFGRSGAPLARLTELTDRKPVLLYTCASMKKGRALEDPYTGQLPCFAKVLAFGDSNNSIRTVIAYFPLQSVASFPSIGRSWNRSKGLRLYRRLIDVIICHGGVLVFPKKSEIV